MKGIILSVALITRSLGTVEWIDLAGILIVGLMGDEEATYTANRAVDTPSADRQVADRLVVPRMDILAVVGAIRSRTGFADNEPEGRLAVRRPRMGCDVRWVDYAELVLGSGVDSQAYEEPLLAVRSADSAIRRPLKWRPMAECHRITHGDG